MPPEPGCITDGLVNVSDETVSLLRSASTDAVNAAMTMDTMTTRDVGGSGEIYRTTCVEREALARVERAIGDGGSVSAFFWRACSQVLSLCAELYYQVPCLMHCRRGPAFICVFRKVIHRQSEEVPTLTRSLSLSEPLESVFKIDKQIAALTYQLLPSFLPSLLPSFNKSTKISATYFASPSSHCHLHLQQDNKPFTQIHSSADHPC